LLGLGPTRVTSPASHGTTPWRPHWPQGVTARRRARVGPSWGATLRDKDAMGLMYARLVWCRAGRESIACRGPRPRVSGFYGHCIQYIIMWSRVMIPRLATMHLSSRNAATRPMSPCTRLASIERQDRPGGRARPKGPRHAETPARGARSSVGSLFFFLMNNAVHECN
jgi:hypothetical protein